MKVKVQYTVDLNHIPSEAAKLLPAFLDFTPDMGRVEDLLSDGNIVNALEIIDQTRKTLYDADLRLSDCVSILEGYLGVKSAPPPQEEETQDDSVS